MLRIRTSFPRRSAAASASSSCSSASRTGVGSPSRVGERGVDALQRRPARAPARVARRGQLEQLRAAVGGIRRAGATCRASSSRRTTSDAVVSGSPSIDASSVSVSGPERADRAQRRVAAGSTPSRASSRSTSSAMRWLAAKIWRRSDEPPLRAGSGDTADLLVEADERQAERLGRVVARDDVVAGLEHRHLVGA